MWFHLISNHPFESLQTVKKNSEFLNPISSTSDYFSVHHGSLCSLSRKKEENEEALYKISLTHVYHCLNNSLETDVNLQLKSTL